MIVKSGLFLHSSLVSLHVKFFVVFCNNSPNTKKKKKKTSSNQIRVAL